MLRLLVALLSVLAIFLGKTIAAPQQQTKTKTITTTTTTIPPLSSLYWWLGVDPSPFGGKNYNFDQAGAFDNQSAMQCRGGNIWQNETNTHKDIDQSSFLERNT